MPPGFRLGAIGKPQPPRWGFSNGPFRLFWIAILVLGCAYLFFNYIK
jgi:hypothetical protein